MSLDIRALDKQRPTKPSAIAKHPFTSYIVASKGGGKTTLLLNMLTNKNIYKNVFNHICIISPTLHLDSKTNILRENEITIPNKKLITKLKKEKKTNNRIFDDPHNVNEENIGLLEFYEKFDLGYLLEILQEQKYITNKYGKEYSNKILFAIDDCIMDKTFHSREFIDFILKSRHYNISMIIISQSYFRLNNNLRLNNTQLLLFENGSKKQLDEIYEENGLGLTKKEFFEIYEYIMSEPYAFMNWNYQNSKKFRLWKNFTDLIEI